MLNAEVAEPGRRRLFNRSSLIGVQEDTAMEKKIRIEHHSLRGGAWFAAWLFTKGTSE